jgi:hypothetical protein
LLFTQSSLTKKQAVTQVTKGCNRWRRHFLTQSEEAQDSEKDNNKTYPPDYVVHACLLKLVHIQTQTMGTFFTHHSGSC